MAQVKIYRGGQTASLPQNITDGAIYVKATDQENGEMYADIGNRRIKIGSGFKASITKTTEEWNAMNPPLLSEQGVIYIYSNARSYIEDEDIVNVPGLKVGDGTSFVVDLPFVNVTAQQINLWNTAATTADAANAAIQDIIQQLEQKTLLDCDAERINSEDQSSDLNLVFSHSVIIE